MKYIFIGLVYIYRTAISPFFPDNCRFYPTCSCYMQEALHRYGAIKGLYLGIKRLLKCQPYYQGNFTDPVPSLVKKKKAIE